MIPEISASKVAGLIGLHKYQSAIETIYELLCKDKTLKARIAAIEKTYNRRPFNAVVNELLRETPVMDCVSAGLEACKQSENVQSTLDDVEFSARVLLDLRYDRYSSELRDRLASEIRGKVTKQRGINNENAVLDQYETQRDVKVTERNTKMARKDHGTFKLIGRIDGYVESEKRIVDSKERTRMWPTVPVYDEIQMRVYMNLLDARESELVERFPDGTTRHTKYTNDPEKWNSIHGAIERAVQRMNAAADNEDELKRIVFLNTVEVA